MSKTIIIYLSFFVVTGLAIAGEVMCIVKAVKCNWEPVGKSEVIYTVSALTGAGVIVGWIDIEDK